MSTAQNSPPLEGEILIDPFEYEMEQRERYRRVMPLMSSPTPMTYGLLVVNVLFFVWSLLVNQELIGQWSASPTASVLLGANWPPAIHGDGQWWRLLSSAFLHGSILHLGFNSYAVYVFAPMIERLLGSYRLLTLSVVTAVVGSFASFLHSDTPSVGFSGAVFGLVGVLFGMTYKYRDQLPDHMAKSIRKGMIQIAAINVFIGFVVPMIDNAAHLGGMAAGVVFAFLSASRLKESAPQVMRARVVGLLALVLVVLSLGSMLMEAGVCGESEQAFYACYYDYLQVEP